MKEIKKEEQEEKKDSQNVLKKLFDKAIKTKIGRIISLSILIVILLLILLIIFRNPNEKVDSEILINTKICVLKVQILELQNSEKL